MRVKLMFAYVLLSVAVFLVLDAASQGVSIGATGSNPQDVRQVSKSGLWSVDLVSMASPSTILCYQPGDKGTKKSGAIIEAPANPFGGVSNYAMIKDEKTGEVFGFFGSEIKPQPGKTLFILKFEIWNNSHKSVSFRVGDLSFSSLDGDPLSFSAVGKGDSPPLTKIRQEEKDAAASITFDLQPGEKETLTFIVGMDQGEPGPRWSFQGGPWIGPSK